MPKKRGKKYIEAAKKVEAAVSSNGNGGLEPEVACQIVSDTSTSKFDAAVEAHPRLGVDPRHARPDAEREVGHCHELCGARGARRQGRQGRVPDRQIRHHPRTDRESFVRLEAAA